MAADSDEEEVERKCREVFRRCLERGGSLEFLQAALRHTHNGRHSAADESAGDWTRDDSSSWTRIGVWSSCIVLPLVLSSVTWTRADNLWPSSRCLVPSSALLMEALRPPADCSFCAGYTSPAELPPGADAAVASNWFAPIAYSGRPAVARGAARDWPALHLPIDLPFLQKLYLQTPGALEAVEEECQFLPLGSEFASLSEALGMDPKRASSASPPFYFGWSNCHPQISKQLREMYMRPEFLPPQSEASALDWLFVGGFGPGAALHLDYVRRPSWQAQLAGRKSWLLQPPLECESQCVGVNFTAEVGDIVLVDTNLWFHTTYIHPGNVSVTVGSEYD